MRYFFHIRDAGGVIADEEGSELSGLPAAHEEARKSARDLVMDDMRRGTLVPNRYIEITDEGGSVVLSYPVRQVIG